ncbi:MAG: SUMF1/EgtB/PvdO family nonheme iron enzyme [Bacteroidales bacterium]|jgi:hypothetical protein|nr:SUMF1/EgtB/PvdO family nonheme iron enzyme [Bacteroidales bacterium]
MRKILFILLPLSIFFVACNKDGLDKLTVDIDDLNLGLLDTYQLVTSPSPNDAKFPVTFHCDDESIATVDANGLVSAIAVGRTQITITAGDRKSGCIVTVTPVNRITLDKHIAMVWVNKTQFQLTPELYPESAANVTVTYTSSNKNIAAVTASGNILPISSGEAVITAKAGIKTDSCIVKVMNFAFPTEQLWLAGGAPFTLDTIMSRNMPEDMIVEFSSEKPEVATIDPQNALVTFIAAGITKISADINSPSYESSVTFEKELLFYNPAVSIDADDVSFDMFKVDGNGTVDDFYIGKYEVTQALWKKVMGNTYITEELNKGTGDDFPMYNVNWYDAVLFCNRMSDLTGRTAYYSIDSLTSDPNNLQTADNKKWTVTSNGGNGFRLPTETEWLHAAMGGNQTHNFDYSGGNDFSAVGWISANAGSNTHEVVGKAINEIVAYDMTGNVREWCFDWYGPTIGTATSGQRRVARGGAFSDVAASIRLSVRGQAQASGLPHQRTTAFGIRLAYSAQ